MKTLLENHSELLAFAKAFKNQYQENIEGTILDTQLSQAINTGNKIRKSVAGTTDFQ